MEPTVPTPGLVFRPLLGADSDGARPGDEGKEGGAAATAGAAARARHL
ncbi:hypothetical protein [Streptomyces sp. NPDC059008]